MNLTISPEAMQWFKKELVVDQGSGIRFLEKFMERHKCMTDFPWGCQ